MSKHNRDRKKKDPRTLPLSERKIVVVRSLEEMQEALEAGHAIDMKATNMDDLYTPELNAALDEIDPCIRDWLYCNRSPEAFEYSFQAKVVVVSYLDTLQNSHREYRREYGPEPMAAWLYDLRHDYGRKMAMEVYPTKVEVIMQTYDAYKAEPNAIPAYWHVRGMPEEFKVTLMPGLWPIVVTGPVTVVIQIPIPV